MMDISSDPTRANIQISRPVETSSHNTDSSETHPLLSGNENVSSDLSPKLKYIIHSCPFIMAVLIGIFFALVSISFMNISMFTILNALPSNTTTKIDILDLIKSSNMSTWCPYDSNMKVSVENSHDFKYFYQYKSYPLKKKACKNNTIIYKNGTHNSNHSQFSINNENTNCLAYFENNSIIVDDTFEIYFESQFPQFYRNSYTKFTNELGTVLNTSLPNINCSTILCHARRKENTTLINQIIGMNLTRIPVNKTGLYCVNKPLSLITSENLKKKGKKNCKRNKCNFNSSEEWIVYIKQGKLSSAECPTIISCEFTMKFRLVMFLIILFGTVVYMFSILLVLNAVTFTVNKVKKWRRNEDTDQY